MGSLALHKIMQKNRSKRYRAAAEQVDRTKLTTSTRLFRP